MKSSKKIDWNKLWENLPETREPIRPGSLRGYTRVEIEVEHLTYVVMKLVERLNEILNQ